MKFNELSHMMQKPEPKPDTYEAGMALNQLLKIGTHAIKIHNMIDDDAEMEAWVAKKIDLASNYVKSVHGYTAGSKAGTYDDDGMSEDASGWQLVSKAKDIAKKMAGNLTGAVRQIEKLQKDLSKNSSVQKALLQFNEDAGFDVEAWSTDKVEDHGPDLMRLAKGQPIEITAWDSYYMDMDDGRPDDDQGNVAADDSIGGEVTSAIRGHMDDIQKADFVGDTLKFKPTADTIKYAQNIIKSPEFKKAYQSTESVSEDAGEGHMSKSQLYQTAKMSIELLDMINKGDDLEGWVQTKLNLAADYLQAVYHYEDYQKLNPYREELDGSLIQRHAGIIQKHLDEILERKCRAEDVDTKPGMMRILKKRVNEVEKEIAKENRKETNEEATIKPYVSMYKGKDGKMVYDVLDKHEKSAFKTSDERVARAYLSKNYNKLREAALDEGIQEWGKRLAMAGVIVAGLAGVNSINNAIDNSVPAVKAMNTALELAQDSGNDELAKMIEKDLTDAKVRLTSGKDLEHVAGLQDKYAKFMKTEGMAYESKLAVSLKQRLK